MWFKVSWSDLTRVLLHNGLNAVVSILQDTTSEAISQILLGIYLENHVSQSIIKANNTKQTKKFILKIKDNSNTYRSYLT